MVDSDIQISNCNQNKCRLTSTQRGVQWYGWSTVLVIIGHGNCSTQISTGYGAVIACGEIKSTLHLQCNNTSVSNNGETSGEQFIMKYILSI